MGVYTGTVPTFLAGELPDADKFTELSNLALALTDVWTAYNPAWSSSGTQPVLNNGSLVGFYRRVGKTVDVVVKLTMGNLTTFGTGTYVLSLPIAATGAVRAVGPLYILDAGTANRSGVAITNTATSVQMITSADGDVGATVPQTFAVNDVIMFSMTYEAA